MIRRRTSSRPARARGLKLKAKAGYDAIVSVAPRAGAWIETSSKRLKSGDVIVAPRAGAWIETNSNPTDPQL